MGNIEVNECDERIGLYPWEEHRGSCQRYMMFDWETGDYWPAKCNCRSCRYLACRVGYAKRTAKRINQDITLNGLDKFFTLTLGRDQFETPAEAWDGIAAIWSKFMRRCRRVYGNFGYVAVLEKHPDNDWPHIHFACNQYMPVMRKTKVSECDEKSFWDFREPLALLKRKDVRTVQEMWWECGGGHVVWAKQRQDGLDEYFCKGMRTSEYTTKDFVDIGDYVKRRKRVVWRSQGLIRAEAAQKATVKFVKGYKPWNEFGRRELTTQEINGIIDREALNTTAKESGHEERQIGQELEGTFEEVSFRGFEESKQIMEAYRRRQAELGEGQGATQKKNGDQRRDQKVDRQVTFEDWSVRDEHCHKVTSG